MSNQSEDDVRITIKPFQNEATQEWCVSLLLTGLSSEQQACRSAEHMAAMFCGDEIPLN